MSLWSHVFVVNIQEKKERKKKHLDGENHFYHHNASVHKTLTFLKGDFHLSPGLKQYACVCVCTWCRCCFLSHCCKQTHTHTQHTHTHALKHTHTSSSSGERHGAMERHSSSGQMHRPPGGDRSCCHGYQGSSNSPALWVSKKKRRVGEKRVR